MPRLNPLLAGALGRCPNCGEGPLFVGFLTVAARCEVCGYDLAKADSGDGPVVFVTLVGGGLACFGALFTQFAFDPPIWVTMIIWMPLTLGLCLGLLRPTKGILLAAQFANKASEAQRDP